MRDKAGSGQGRVIFLRYRIDLTWPRLAGRGLWIIIQSSALNVAANSAVLAQRRIRVFFSQGAVNPREVARTFLDWLHRKSRRRPGFEIRESCRDPCNANRAQRSPRNAVTGQSDRFKVKQERRTRWRILPKMFRRLHACYLPVSMSLTLQDFLMDFSILISLKQVPRKR
jgi:hypothetical protein